MEVVVNVKDNLHFHDSRRKALTRISKKVEVMDLAKISRHRKMKIILIPFMPLTHHA